MGIYDYMKDTNFQVEIGVEQGIKNRIMNYKIENNVEIHKYDSDDYDGNYRYGLFHFVKI